MKIKDLPQDRSLGGVAFLHPKTGEVCYWRSQWQKGVWFRKHPKDDQVHPLFLDDLSEAMELELPLSAETITKG